MELDMPMRLSQRPSVENLGRPKLGAASFWFHQAVRGQRLPAVRRRFAGVDAIRTEPAGVDRSLVGCWKILRRHIGKPSQINVCLKEKSKLSGSHRNVVISRG
jgi:hypothetical protein